MAIGINDYLHCRKLNNAVKDVRDFIALMTSKYLFEADNITTLFDAEATSRQIVNAFRNLAQKVTADDNLIIYFSGHGEFDKILQQGYWIPVNAEKGEIDDYLPNSTVRDVLNAINSHHTFLIADSCFSGSLFSSRDANRDISQRLETEPSRWGLTSGRNEVVSDGLPDTNSPFAEKLLDVLRKNDKPLGVAEICAKIMEIVQANAAQTPRGEVLNVKGHNGGQFFFHPKNNEAEDWAKVDKTSVVALNNFKKKHPLSIHGAEIVVFMQKIAEKEAEAKRLAEAKRKEEAEKQAYNRALAHPTAYNLNQFLKNYPLSIYAESIEKRLAEAEEEAAWKEAKNQNSITAYRGFMRRYPQSGLAVEAQKRIEAKEAELEAGEMRRQQADKQAAERKQQAEKEAADKQKAAEAKAEQDRQKKTWEAEAAQRKSDRDKVERERFEKERLAQQERDKEKAEKEYIGHKNLVTSEADKKEEPISNEKVEDKEFIQLDNKKKVKFDFFESMGSFMGTFILLYAILYINYSIRFSFFSYITPKGFWTTISILAIIPAFVISICFENRSESSGFKVIDLAFTCLILLELIYPSYNFYAFKLNLLQQVTSNNTISVKKGDKQDQIPYRAVAAAKQLEPEMVDVKGGSYEMDFNDGVANEKSIYEVVLDDFKIGKYEITQWQWRAVMGNNPSYFQNCDDCPVEKVSWDDIQDFLKKINAKTGKKYRLPTEAEWEYAAKGGNKSNSYTYSGSSSLDAVAWYDKNSGGKTHPIGQKQANELSICDMSGNVWEWCRISRFKNIEVPPSDSAHILRGGSCIFDYSHCRSSFRFKFYLNYQYIHNTGFRLAID